MAATPSWFHHCRPWLQQRREQHKINYCKSNDQLQKHICDVVIKDQRRGHNVRVSEVIKFDDKQDTVVGNHESNKLCGMQRWAVCYEIGGNNSPSNEATDVPQQSYPSTYTPTNTRVQAMMHLRSIPCADTCLAKLANPIRSPLLLCFPKQYMLQRQQSLSLTTTWRLPCNMAEHTFSSRIVNNIAIWIARMSWELYTNFEIEGEPPFKEPTCKATFRGAAKLQHRESSN